MKLKSETIFYEIKTSSSCLKNIREMNWAIYFIRVSHSQCSDIQSWHKAHAEGLMDLTEDFKEI